MVHGSWFIVEDQWLRVEGQWLIGWLLFVDSEFKSTARRMRSLNLKPDNKQQTMNNEQ